VSKPLASALEFLFTVMCAAVLVASGEVSAQSPQTCSWGAPALSRCFDATATTPARCGRGYVCDTSRMLCCAPPSPTTPPLPAAGQEAGIGTQDAPGPCTQQVEASKDAPATPGAYKPACTAQGYFQPIQTHGSTGYSWCVNPKTGDKLEGTEAGPGATPTCPACVTAMAKALSSKLAGAYVPQCNNTGNFKPLQNNPATGLRWCVNPKTGAKVPGTERKKGQPAPAC